MKYRDTLTNGFIETEKHLKAPRYEPVHEGDPCWCETELPESPPEQQTGFMNALRRSFGEEE